MQERTYGCTHWAGWRHKAKWPPGRRCWAPPSLWAPLRCTPSCCPCGRRCRLWWSACWCCFALGTPHQKWPPAHGGRSFAGCCSCFSLWGLTLCCLMRGKWLFTVKHQPINHTCSTLTTGNECRAHAVSYFCCHGQRSLPFQQLPEQDWRRTGVLRAGHQDLWRPRFVSPEVRSTQVSDRATQPQPWTFNHS